MVALFRSAVMTISARFGRAGGPALGNLLPFSHLGRNYRTE
jgi:hypothetical protein